MKIRPLHDRVMVKRLRRTSMRMAACRVEAEWAGWVCEKR